jgi:histidinol-phosphate aminotransferase
MAGNDKNPAGSRYDRLTRNLYRSGGYVFAAKAEDIARQHGISRVARLASNENPWPPSAAAVREGCEALKGANRYPDESMATLTGALARFHGDYCFVTGVGMDGVIETVIRTLVSPGDRVAVSVPTFSFYRLAALAQAAEVVEIPREPDFPVNTGLFIDQARDAKVSFLCSPNNPTGTVTPAEEVREILSGISGILFLDNAYVEFSDSDYLPLMKEFDNLVIGRTMSKAFALAGARVGYAVVPGWLVPFYQRAATPFTLNTVSASAAAGALEDRAGMERYVAYVREWRKRFREECALPSCPSGANFVMFDTAPATGDEMVRLLAEKGVIVRSCASFPGLPDRYIRVSEGDEWENELFLSAITGICRSRA